MENPIFVGEIGKQFDFYARDKDNNPLDLTGMTPSILVRKPSGDTLEIPCGLVDAAEGHFRWTTSTIHDLNVAGEWQVNGKATGGGKTFYFKIRRPADKFIVEPVVVANTAGGSQDTGAGVDSVSVVKVGP